MGSSLFPFSSLLGRSPSGRAIKAKSLRLFSFSIPNAKPLYGVTLKQVQGDHYLLSGVMLNSFTHFFHFSLLSS